MSAKTFVCARCKLAPKVYGSYCKPCKSIKVKEWRANNLQHYRDTNTTRQQRYRKEFPSTRLMKNYGITRQEYMEMWHSQNGRCAICEQPETFKGNKWLSVDHNHHTGKVRELLCRHCNMAIGILNEDTTRILKLAAYLDEHNKSI